MSIHDDTLLDIMSEAARGTGVLVLSYDIALIPSHVLRAKELFIEGLRLYGGYSAASAQAFVRPSKIDWKIVLDNGGWVLFYPASDVLAANDFGNPAYVYLRDEKGKYERQGFKMWKMSLVPEVVSGEEVPTDPFEPETKTTWEQLLEDDD